MKKALLAFAITTCGLCSSAFWYLQNNLYCSIINENIIVSLKPEDATDKCSEYLRILNTSLKKEYKDFLLVQSYIDNHQSISYRRSIRNEKQEKIIYITTMKDKIVSAMTAFEGNVFTQIKEYMVYISRPYSVRYRRMLRPIQMLETGAYEKLNSHTKNVILLLQNQVATIDVIRNSTWYDVLNSWWNQYLLLKKQIEWK